jgi:hypothetical protein
MTSFLQDKHGMAIDKLPSKFDRGALTTWVIKKLKDQCDLDDITYDICQATGWDWQASQNFISQIQADHNLELAIYQIRLYVVIGVGTVLVGLVILIVIYLSAVGYGEIGICRRVPYPEPIYTIYQVLKVDTSFQSCLKLAVLSMWNLYSLSILGLGMVAGGLIGIYNALRRLS